MDTARRLNEAARSTTRAPGLVRSVAASAVSGGAALTLGTAGRDLLLERPLSIDAVVGGTVMAAGTVAGAVLALGCALLAAGALARLAGRSARQVEALAALLTPLVVRRALAVTLSAGLGLGVAAPAGAAEADLGWTVTTDSATSQDVEPDRTSAPAEDLVVAPVAAGAGSSLPRATLPRASPPSPTPPGTGGPDSSTPTPTSSQEEPSRSLPEGPGRDPSGAWSTTVEPALHGTTDTLAAADRPAAAAQGTPLPTPLAEPGNVEPAPGREPVQAAESVQTAQPVQAAEPPLLPSPAPSTEPPVTTISVAPGDSLWSLAATHLGADATRQEIAASWPRWYAENRTTIGADPDRIRPGMTLVVPTTVGPEAGPTATELSGTELSGTGLSGTGLSDTEVSE